MTLPSAEQFRLQQDARREKNWKRWGPYLSERQWGTVREDYSADGSVWSYFPFEHSHLRAYRWGEDGLLGICDRQCRLCFSLALWNGKDPILKERLFGLTNAQGNHGEDVKEVYHYLDATPTSSYLKALYKYPQAAFPYEQLVKENGRRSRDEREYELVDTGIFDDSRYWDIVAEYAKADDNDLLIRLTVHNRGSDAATLHLLPTLWFRNAWSWGCTHDGCYPKPWLWQEEDEPLAVRTDHTTLGQFALHLETLPQEVLFTENETNAPRLWPDSPPVRFAKDGFHRRVIEDDVAATNPNREGTKAAAWYLLDVPAGKSASLRLRLRPADAPGKPFVGFDETFATRRREADQFYDQVVPDTCRPDDRTIARQAYAGLLWSKQFYHYVVEQWLEGDPSQPPPPPRHRHGRNASWGHLFNFDVISMPDKWEYPWYAAWDLAFHMIPMARIDPAFAKQQLVLMLREWYMRPDGAIPAYEFNFGDVNPPVHAWACWRVYKMSAPRGQRDRTFLARCFHKLLLNFTWWVNRHEAGIGHLFGGGFLGLDNIGVFDRSDPPDHNEKLQQADGTAWMAFYCMTMLSMALELASEDPSYEDVASKFFEHFAVITHAMNTASADEGSHLQGRDPGFADRSAGGRTGTGLWDEQDRFYYDRLVDADGNARPLRIRSLVGLLPLTACGILDGRVIDRLPGFRKRMNWFLEHQTDLARHVEHQRDSAGGDRYLLAVARRERLQSLIDYLFDPNEFLSPFGVRSLSKFHDQHPFVFQTAHGETCVRYTPGEATTNLFGGNSNWRGPIWFPTSYLLIDALERYHEFYGDDIKVTIPGHGEINLLEAAGEMERRLVSLFRPDEAGRRPCLGENEPQAEEANQQDLLLFHEYFHAETGRGCGASHQTGWTALVATLIDSQYRRHKTNGNTQPSVGRKTVSANAGAGVDLS